MYNFSGICRMANMIVKGGIKRRDAFKQAWRAAKHGIIEKVVGVSYGGRQGILEQLDQYHNADIQIQIEHERNNPFDVNAILVTASVVGHDLPMRIGYLDRRNAGIWVLATLSGVRKLPDLPVIKLPGIIASGNKSEKERTPRDSCS